MTESTDSVHLLPVNFYDNRFISVYVKNPVNDNEKVGKDAKHVVKGSVLQSTSFWYPQKPIFLFLSFLLKA